MTNSSLSLLVLRCADLRRSLRFYEALELRFTEERHLLGPAHYATTLPDGLVLELYASTSAGAAPGGSAGDVRLGLSVDDLTSVLVAVDRIGERIIRPSDVPVADVDKALVVDPDGRRVELTAGRLEVPPPPTRPRTAPRPMPQRRNPLGEGYLIESVDDLILVVAQLALHREHYPQEWENAKVSDYLWAIAEWLRGFPASYVNADHPVPTPDWRFVADVLRQGRAPE